MNVMSEVKFDLKPVDEKPSRRYRKGSKYDPIIDAFIARAKSRHLWVAQ